MNAAKRTEIFRRLRDALLGLAEPERIAEGIARMGRAIEKPLAQTSCAAVA